MDETDINPHYKRPTHIDQLGLKHKPIKLEQSIIDKVNAATGNGTKDFHKAYAIIADHLEETRRGPEQLIFWFRKAAEINSNASGSTANAAIRGGNDKAADIDGRAMNSEIQQKISNDIGLAVIEKIRNGSVPNLHTITQDDAFRTIKDISLDKNNPDISNWVGAAWSWNIPITINGKTRTIGAHIMADPERLEKFMKVQAAAGHHAIDKVNTLGEVNEVFRMKKDEVMGPPRHIRDDIQKRIQTRWRRELPHDANDPYSKHDFGTPPLKNTPQNEDKRFFKKEPSSTLSHPHPNKQSSREDTAPQKRIKLIAAKKEPVTDIPEKGPVRVDNDPFYNPLDFKNNGFEDLMGEVHLLKKNRKRFIEFAQIANRSNDFPLILEDV